MFIVVDLAVVLYIIKKRSDRIVRVVDSERWKHGWKYIVLHTPIAR